MSLLEIQVVEIQEDLTDTDEDVTEVEARVTLLEGDVNFLFDETIIQDARIFTLEQTSMVIDEEVEGIYLFSRLFNFQLKNRDHEIS